VSEAIPEKGAPLSGRDVLHLELEGLHRDVPRVVVTGTGVLSPVGNSVADSIASLRAGKSGVRYMPEWEVIGDLKGRIGATVEGIDFRAHFDRKQRRTMGRVAMLAVHATQQAVAEAGLDPEILASPRVAVAFGSTHGSGSEADAFSEPLALEKSMRGLEGNAFFRFMSHTVAVNVAPLLPGARPRGPHLHRVHQRLAGDRHGRRAHPERGGGRGPHRRRRGDALQDPGHLRSLDGRLHPLQRCARPRALDPSTPSGTAWCSARARARWCWSRSSTREIAARTSSRRSWATGATAMARTSPCPAKTGWSG
jgi:hypothetical protein